MWQYIKSNRLQDPDDKGRINLNAKLQQVWPGSEKIEFHQLLGMLKGQMHEYKPVELAFEVTPGAAGYS